LAFARSAIALPTALAASMLPVPFRPSATSFCSVDADGDHARVGVEHLRVDVLRGAMHAQAHDTQFVDLGAAATGSLQTTDFLFHGAPITSSSFP
jgi:hypothetical protein